MRKSSKPVFLVVNKLDTPNRTDEIWEFYQLGLGDPWPVSAVHGHGTGDLLDEVASELAKLNYDGKEETAAINVAIIGRPNAGKSSLTNRLTDNDRSIVSDVAGTTRDAIDTLVEHDGEIYRIVDTAGLRRKSQIDEDVEYYGFVRAMRAIDRADVALLVIDGTLGLTNEDQRVAGYAAERGCAMAIILNKWDIVEGPGGEGEDPRAHRGSYDVRRLRPRHRRLGPHGQEGRPRVGGHRSRVRGLLARYPDQPAQRVAR